MSLSLRKRLSFSPIKVFMKLSNLWRVATDSLIATELERMALNEAIINLLSSYSVSKYLCILVFSELTRLRDFSIVDLICSR